MKKGIVHILGGGPAGMATAYYLSKLKIKCIVYEQNNSLGGMARSWQWNNFIVDTGPHILHTPEELIWQDWKFLIGETLEEGQFFSANYKKFNENYLLFDYPLNLDQILNSQYWDNNQIKVLKQELNNTPDTFKTSNASSFKDYIDGLIGETLSREFFTEYPQKVWSIPPDKMLPDWAPKRIRRCKKRETFFKDQYCGISAKGSGYIFEKIREYIEIRGCKVLSNTKVESFQYKNNRIHSIKTTEQVFNLLGKDDIVISTIPITILSKMLGKEYDLDFRGISSTYISFENQSQIIPDPYQWIYFGNKDILFNRITEPTKLSKKLNLDIKNNRSYLIAETTFTTSKDNLKNLDNEKLINKTYEDLKITGLIKDYLPGDFDINIEPYVYPIQSNKNKLLLKECNTYLSNFRNLELIGTSANFAYNDMQVIFKQSKELAEDISKSFNNLESLSRVSFLSELVDNAKDEDNSIKLNVKNFHLINRFELIAEIGINHNGDFDRLKNLIQEASRHSDIIKLQYYKTNSRVGKNVRELNHVEKAQDIEENILELLNRCEINFKDLKKAIKIIKDLKRIPMCTAFDLEALEDLLKIGLTHIKIASMDLNNYAIHNYLINIKQKLHIYISTGMSSIHEINEVSNLYKKSIHAVTFLLCNSSYPSPLSSLNIAGLFKLKGNINERFNIGYSDHSIGNEACLTALALGAKSLEVHFTDNKNISGPDQLLSKNKEDLSFIKEKGVKIKECIGGIKVGVQPSEYETWRTQKKSLHASKKIKKGDVVNLKNTIAISPPDGISPLELFKKKYIAKCDINIGSSIRSQDLEEL